MRCHKGPHPGSPTGVPATAAASTAAVDQPRLITLADAKHCPVTLPHSGDPPRISPDAFFGWGASYGDGTLWVGGVWPRGVIEAGPDFVAKDGSVGLKFGWWRAARGKLTITGRRLDAPAPSARGSSPTATAPPAFRPARSWAAA